MKKIRNKFLNEIKKWLNREDMKNIMNIIIEKIAKNKK